MSVLFSVRSFNLPANAVAHGGVDMAPNAKRKPKDDVSTRADADAEDMLRRTIVKKLGKNVKENMDNNNIILKRVNEIKDINLDSFNLANKTWSMKYENE